MEAPPPFLEALQSLQDQFHWRQTRDQLFNIWLPGIDAPRLVQYVRDHNVSSGFEMWDRAGHERWMQAVTFLRLRWLIGLLLPSNSLFSGNLLLEASAPAVISVAAPQHPVAYAKDAWCMCMACGRGSVRFVRFGLCKGSSDLIGLRSLATMPELVGPRVA